MWLEVLKRPLCANGAASINVMCVIYYYVIYTNMHNKLNMIPLIHSIIIIVAAHAHIDLSDQSLHIYNYCMQFA